MSEDKGVNLSSSSGLKLTNAFKDPQESLEKESEEEGGGQDQIIIFPPEIISMILEVLDFQNLKRARLVCRRWLPEASFHMRRRGAVTLRSFAIPRFAETHFNKFQDLPQPFGPIHAEVNNCAWHPPEFLVSLLSSLCPPPSNPLMNETMPLITRLSCRNVPLDLLLSLIIQTSPSLEYLLLCSSESFEDDYFPLMSSEQVFLKLRHLVVDTSNFKKYDAAVVNSRKNHFPSIVAWIVGASPALDRFHSSGAVNNLPTDKVATELLMRVDIKDVKTLESFHEKLDKAALVHFQAIPFSRLENLAMYLGASDELERNENVLMTTVSKCTATLKVLNLSTVTEDPGSLAAFPICPALHELTLHSLRFAKFIADRVPALQVLNVQWIRQEDMLESTWRDLRPLLYLRTLRVNLPFVDKDELSAKCFETFPALERVCHWPPPNLNTVSFSGMVI